MRVLTIVGDLGLGGTQKVAYNYTLGYKNAGYEVAVLAIDGAGAKAEELKNADIPVFIGGNKRSDIDKSLQSAQNWKPDIIHIHRRGFAEAKTAHLLKELKTPQNRVLETNVFARVDYSQDRSLIDVHLQLTRWCLWKWRQWSSGIKPTLIGAVVPNMIDSKAFFPVSANQKAAFRINRGIPQEAFVFGRIGQPLPSKWSPMIFNAFTLVAQAYPQVYLLLVGLPAQLRPSLALVPQTIQKRIIEIPLLKSDTDLRTCYSAINAFLHASDCGESFGMVLAEAMLCGCPVITLSTPHKDNSQLEVVGHQRGGLVVTSQTSMVEAMVRLIEDEALRLYLSQEGALWIKSHYDISQAMPNLIKIASMAIAEETRDKLQAELENDPQIITHVSWKEIQSILKKTMGNTPLKEFLLMDIVHNPLLYRLYSHRLK